MYSVTQRANSVKQPYGGYLRPSRFQKIELECSQILNEEENIHPTVIGIVVDYLTRFMMGKSIQEAFAISFQGAKIAEILGFKGYIEESIRLGKDIKGLDDESIISACKLVTLDMWRRNPFAAMVATSYKETNPDIDTIENIRIMVERSIKMWSEYGPIVADGFTFEPTGYTETVSSGDGDYLTEDTLWDFKVSKNRVTSKQTLQLLMYWIMGRHSGKPEFQSIKKLGIYNPRLNIVYLYKTERIFDYTIKEVEKDIIGYPE